MARLDQICKLNMGQSPDSSSYNENKIGMPFFQGNADFGTLHPTVRIWCSAPTKVANSGDILISVRAPIGALNIANVECCIGRGLAALTVDERKCKKEYLLHAISSKVDELNSKGTGSTFKAISKNILAETEIPLPNLDMQTHIAAVLDKIDNLISFRKQQLAKLDELVKARFIEMFGDPETNPNRWSISKLSEFCDLQNGYAFKSDDYLTNSTVLNCRMSNIRPDGGFDAEYHPKYLPDTFWEKYKEYRLVDGDVIIAMTDMASDPKILGVPTIVRTNGKKFLLNQRVGKLTFYDNTTINNVYLMFVLSQKHIRQQLVKSAGGSTQINVGKPAVLAVEFFVPPMELQNQFATFVEQTDKSKLTIQQSLDKLETLKKALMQEYFG